MAGGEVRSRSGDERNEKTPFYIKVRTYVGFGRVFIVQYIKHLFRRKRVEEPDGYPPLYTGFESFLFRSIYPPSMDLCARPICSAPGAEMDVMERVTHDGGLTMEFTGNKLKCLNMGSYNYLGFTEPEGACASASRQSIIDLGLGSCSPRQELGTMAIHEELERTVARFLGVEDSITFGMGFATNALNIPCLVSQGCLVLSDEKNHASIILGMILSGAMKRIFKHDDMHDLECRLRQAVVEGQPASGAPWRKIVIVVEGIYSMEGTIVNLPEVIALKKKYKAYIYLDEAHSVGAMGPRGRGVVDYYGCDPGDVDVLMGTFSKSFSSAGGYIAGSKKLIDHIRIKSHAACYATSMSPPVAQQVIKSMQIIMGEDGTDEGQRRRDQLLRNTHYFRRNLRKMGLIVYGDEDSPVVPVMVFMYPKLATTSRELLKRGVASVIVCYPATRLAEGRIRFCISASHTKEILDKVLHAVDQVSDLLDLKYSKLPKPVAPIIYGQTKDVWDEA